MTREQEIKDILKKISFQLTYKTKVLLFALLGVGILGLGLGFFLDMLNWYGTPSFL